MKPPPPKPKCAYHDPLNRMCSCIKPAVTAEDVEKRRSADAFHAEMRLKWW